MKPNEPDPSRIDILHDPTRQRMSGIARHGHTPFDVPIISHIQGNLWQGGCENGMILPKSMRFVVSLYPWEKYTCDDTVVYDEIKMYDSEDQSYQQVDEIARKVLEYTKQGPTLVHCQAGLNRSSLIAARVLMMQGLSGADAIALLRKQRSPACLCNKAFENWILTNPL